MHPDGVRVGVDPQQQQVDGGSAAEAVLDGLLKIHQPLPAAAGRQGVVAAVGRAALMGGIAGTEVVEHHLQIAGVLVGGVGHPLPVAAMLGLDPAVDRVLHIEQGSGMGPPPHRAERNPQGEGDGMGEPAVGAGGDIQQVEAAGEQKGVEFLRGRAAGLARQGIVAEKTVAGLLVGLEDAPGEQGAHVELADPGLLEDRQGQAETQLLLGQGLGPFHEVVIVLQGREPLQHRHDPVEGILHASVVGLEGGVGGGIGERMQAHGPVAEPHRRQAPGEIGATGCHRPAPGGAGAEGADGGGRTAGHRGPNRGRRRTP